MSYAVHAELTPNAERIILIAAGCPEEIAYAARSLQTLTPLISHTDPPGALSLRATWPAAIQLAAQLGSAWTPGPRLRAWVGDAFALRTAPVDEALGVPVPEGLQPRPYQVAGARLIAATGRALITDEPGTGKTITTILGLRQLMANGPADAAPPFPILIVCPASVVDPWVQAFRTWWPELTTVAWRGAPDRRKKLTGTAHVYVTSYDTATRDANDTRPRNSPLIKLGAQCLVIDECHYIKNSGASRTWAVKRLAHLAHAAVVALSGTPITHHADDLHPVLDCLVPDAWPSKERFTARYVASVQQDYQEVVLGLNKHTEPEFRLALLGQHRRVAKADVLAQLPPKVYSVRSVELPPAHRKSYDDFERDMLAELPDGQVLSVMAVLTQLNFLSVLASAAVDVETTTEIDDETGEEKTHTHAHLKAPSWKVDALLEVLEERPGSPVVAFAPSRQLVILAGEAAAKAGHRVGYIVGGQSMRERTDTVASFQAGQLDLVCATTGAGGTGITLTASSTVVFLQRPWSLVESIQAEDRCHRIGSEIHESIEVIDIVAAKTVDARVRAVLHEKAGQLSELLQDPRIVAELLGGASVRQLRKAG